MQVSYTGNHFSDGYSFLQTSELHLCQLVTLYLILDIANTQSKVRSCSCSQHHRQCSLHKASLFGLGKICEKGYLVYIHFLGRIDTILLRSTKLPAGRVSSLIHCTPSPTLGRIHLLHLSPMPWTSFITLRIAREPIDMLTRVFIPGNF